MAYTTIDLPTEYFNTTAYTGDGVVGRNLTTGIFQPDWVWIKSRSDADNHRLVDAVRGATKHLESDNDTAEQTSSNVTAFTPTGITLSSNGAVNANTETYVAWAWLGANSTASNTAGSITSTVSANTTSGFSIVSYTGNGVAGATIGHGLGSTPSAIIVKKRSDVGDWSSYHSVLGNTGYMRLNNTNAFATASTYWNNTSPDNDVFTVGTTGNINGSGVTYIAYCFADVKGFSKFGSYTGNNSTDGPFIYMGFKPAFVLIKATNTTQWWTLLDNKRDTYNVATLGISPNSSNSESTFNTDRGPHNMDFVSNGLKIRTDNSGINGTNSFIYMAFAENPFVTSTSIPTTAR
jgi:hypothetical protein